jgi:hypothetical protein
LNQSGKNDRLTVFLDFLRKKIPLWIPVAFLALLIRLPILQLPGAGRDEALYFYWSKHPQPAYSPLLQLLLKLFDALPLPDLTAMRLPSIFAGVFVLVLFEKLLRHRGIDRSGMSVALLALAFTPWQLYTGAVLHPDNLLLCCMLFFLLAAIKQQYSPLAVAAAMAFWAKPSGILLLPVLFDTLWFSGRISRKRAGYITVLYLFLVIPVAFAFNPEMLRAMSEFSRMDPSTSFLKGMGVQLVTLFLMGGLFLPALGFWGFIQRFKRFFPAMKTDVDLRFTLLTAVVLLGAFGGAALFFRQVKGNWLLPALVILWPKKPLPQAITTAGLVITILLSLGSTTAVTRPDIVAGVEKVLPAWKNSYSLQAGAREARVSATVSWSQRYREYQTIDHFLKGVQAAWEQENTGHLYPEWIVSDDYGLTAQLVFAWSRAEQKLILPKDDMFIRSLPDKHRKKLSGRVLVLSVFHPPQLIWPRLENVSALGTVPHPVTGREVHLGVSEGILVSLPEDGYTVP